MSFDLIAGTVVNADSKKFNGLFKAEIVRLNKDGTVRVKFDDGNEETLPKSRLSERKRGRKSISASYTPAEIVTQIDELTAELEQAIELGDIPAQKRIRRKLRLRGHTGGLQGNEAITVVGRKVAEAAGITVG